MTSRRASRRLAFQLLYQNDISGCDIEETLAQVKRWPLEKLDKEGLEYVQDVVRGTFSHREEIDAILTPVFEHWRLKRVGVSERNILRLAVYELLYRPDVPARVSINEAVNLAKRFADIKSWSFVNGVLDNVFHNVVEPDS